MGNGEGMKKNVVMLVVHGDPIDTGVASIFGTGMRELLCVIGGSGPCDAVGLSA